MEPALSVASPQPLGSAPESPWPARRLASLELLHPDGMAPGTLVLGDNCPAALRPTSVAPAGAPADLVLLVPTAAQCRAGGWLAGAVGALARQLAPEGVVYAIVPPPWRWRAARLLRNAGLAREGALLHLPNATISRHLLPLRPDLAPHVFSHLVPLRPWRRGLVGLALRLPGGANALAGALPSVGLVARRAGARPLAGWLFALAPAQAARGDFVLSLGTREQKGTALLFRFARRAPRPDLVAKVALTAAAARNRIGEAAVIERHGPAARAAGGRVPAGTAARAGTGYPALVQPVLEGRPAASLLAEEPDRLPLLLARCADWLAAWNRETVVSRPLERAWLARELLGPATLLVADLTDGPAYLAWLAERCARVTGQPVPLVATHNDLTMRNILVADDGRLGIVDWESARDEGLPLGDFLYAAADAAAAIGRYADRPGAFAACFEPGGAYTDLVAHWVAHLCHAVALPAGLADLCAHACWLRHAANERVKIGTGERRPFLAIAQQLVLRRDSFAVVPGE
jgi:Ser/Thr protein kinase RdoA (MazF antagonist)